MNVGIECCIIAASLINDMSHSLEFAMMLESIAALSSSAETRLMLKAQVAELLKDVPSEIARAAEMSLWLHDELSRPTISGGALEIPISYI